MDPYSRYEMRLAFMGTNPLNSMAVIRDRNLPAPLQEKADAMYDAKTGDEAKAAASEFLTVSEEWTVDE